VVGAVGAVGDSWVCESWARLIASSVYQSPATAFVESSMCDLQRA
jgi:hypothetical protein